MVVTSTGPGSANNVVLNDPLPTLGNLNHWTITTNPGGCTIVSNTLNCSFGNLANGQTTTVVVATDASGGADITACPGGQKLNNTATLTGAGLPTLTDTGDYTCTPPSITIVKTPDNATFNIGDTLTFTMVVTNGSPGTAHNVVLNDPLPTKGGVLGWTFDTGGNPGNVCTILSNVLNCAFGNLASGQTKAVVVKTTIGAPQLTCDANKIINTATVTSSDAGTHTDTGDYICKPSNTSARITGGGSIFATVNGKPNIRVTHGLELRCDPNDPRQSLEINWDGGNNFHLDKLINSVTCFDDPKTQPPPPPNTVVDTYAGTTLFNGHTGYHGFGYAVGTGTCNKLPATIYFILNDAGEPGKADVAEYHITGGCTLDAGPAFLDKGNHQFHKN
jgi:uncharacterized repeat protein (TIGR01451 family)